MTIHPVIFFILTVIFSLPVILIGGKRLYDLHKVVYGSSPKRAHTANFLQLTQNHPVLGDGNKSKGRASPDLNDQENHDIRGSLDKLVILLFKARPPKEEKPVSGQAKADTAAKSKN